MITKSIVLEKAEMENEDHLLYQFLRSRAVSMEKLKGNCQNFILVASLLDRIPNLAGLARTCEVCYSSNCRNVNNLVYKLVIVYS